MAFPFSFWGAFTPRSISGLQYWMSARDISAAYQASLASLPDSVNGWVATQGTGTNQARFLPHAGGAANNYLRLPGISGNYASTPDSAALDITGNIDVRWYGAMNDWTPSAAQILVGKWNTVGNQRSYLLSIATTGAVQFQVSTNGEGGGIITAVSSVAPTVSDLGILGIRATRNSATGEVIFYTSTDGLVWSQLGSAQSTSAGGAFSGSAIVEVGSLATGTANLLIGRVFYAQIYNGINGTLVASFDASRGNGNSSTIVASTGETWTINRTGADPAMIVSSPQVLFITDDYYDLPSASYGVAQNVGGITMFSVMAASSLASETNPVSISTNAVTPRAGLATTTVPAFRVGGRRTDADSFGSVSSFTPVVNTSAIVAGVLDYSNASARVFVNGSGGTAGAFQTPGNTSNTSSVAIRIGASTALVPANLMNGLISEVLIYNRALTASEVLQVSQYLAARTGGAIAI